MQSLIFSLSSSSSSSQSPITTICCGSSKALPYIKFLFSSICSMISCSLLNISWCVIVVSVAGDTQNFPVLLNSIAFMHCLSSQRKKFQAFAITLIMFKYNYPNTISPINKYWNTASASSASKSSFNMLTKQPSTPLSLCIVSIR